MNQQNITFTAKIPVYRRNLFARALGPLIWVKNYIEALKDQILHMIWKELFSNETEPEQLTHIIAFVVFSGFCLLAYEGNIENYVLYFFFALWPLDHIIAHHHFGHQRHTWISLKAQEAGWLWQRHGMQGRQPEKRMLQPAQINRVILRAETHAVDAYSNINVSVWEVFLQLSDSDENLIVQHETDFSKAMRKAMKLADTLKVPLTVADSNGQGSFAETPTEASHLTALRANWRSSPDGHKLHKSLRTVNLLKLAQTVVDESGSFIFLAVMYSVMKHYGIFLAWFLGPKLGFGEPFMLHLDLSFSGILGFFAPTFDWRSSTIFMVTLAVILHSVWKNSRRQRFRVSAQSLDYQLAGKPAIALPVAEIRQLLLLHRPQPGLVVISQQRILVVDSILDMEEQEELYARLCALLPNVPILKKRAVKRGFRVEFSSKASTS